jgi:hypothetical protein
MKSESNVVSSGGGIWLRGSVVEVMGRRCQKPWCVLAWKE